MGARSLRWGCCVQAVKAAAYFYDSILIIIREFADGRVGDASGV